MHTGPAKPVAKKRREVLLWLRHPLFVRMKLSLPYRSPKKIVQILCSSSKMECNSYEFTSVVLLHRPSSQPFHKEKISPFRWRTERSWALGEKCASRSSTLLCLLCLQSSACAALRLWEGRGKKLSVSAHSWKTSSVTQQSADPLCHRYRSTQTKRGMLGSFWGVAPPDYALSLFSPITVRMVMFECRCLCLCFPSFLPTFYAYHSLSHFKVKLFPQNILLTCILSLLCVRKGKCILQTLYRRFFFFTSGCAHLHSGHSGQSFIHLVQHSFYSKDGWNCILRQKSLEGQTNKIFRKWFLWFPFIISTILISYPLCFAIFFSSSVCLLFVYLLFFTALSRDKAKP